MPSWDSNEPDWGQRARAAVEAALAGAPELAESHLAAAIHAVQHGEYKHAAESLRQALRIAPTYAAAHEYLGRLQLEAGRAQEGVAHLELALQLDPNLASALPDLARFRVLRGDLQGFDEQMRRIVSITGREDHPSKAMLEIRAGTWYRDVERIKRGHQVLGDATPDGHAMSAFTNLLLVPELNVEQLHRNIETVIAVARNQRFVAMIQQWGAEASAYHGHEDLALEFMREAADGVLVDLEWLERCPLFDSLRSRPEFEAIRQIVRRRAEAVWATTSVNTN
jgi:serine/threonine-protein kinase